MDVGGEDKSVESPLVLKSVPFHQGESVFAHFSGGIHKAKVLQVHSGAKHCFVHYYGFNKKWDEWVGVERLIKLNIQNQKAPVKENPLKKITELKPKNPNVKSDKKRKTMSKGGAIEGWAENEFVTPVVPGVPLAVVGNPGVKVGWLKAQARQRAKVVTPTPRVGEKSLFALSMAMKKLKGPMDKPLGSTLQPPLNRGPKLWEPRVAEPSCRFIPGWSLTNDADLFDLDNASDFMTHVLPPKTKTRLLAMPETEFWKSYDSAVVNNFAHMVEMKRRYDTLKAKDNEVKEELTRCKATMTSQAKDISIAAEVAVGMRKELDDANGKVKEMQAERGYVIKGASRAEAARAQAEVETSALRAGRLELLGKLSEAENQAAVLKAENAELLKKLGEAEAAKSHVGGLA